MFYTQLFTAKRGPLAKIWLAAHWDRKLTKAHVFECNLESSIRDIISPKMKIGLRTSGHLLIGVVRIYSRKAKYLLADCSDALVKIKIAFRPGQTDLTVKGLEATVKAITLIEDFTAFDTQLPDPSMIDAVDHFSLNQCQSEEITLREDLGIEFLDLVDFGDESHIDQTGLLDVRLERLAYNGDGFGDEDKGFDLLGFLALSSDPAESTDLISDAPQTENPESSVLSYPQNDADRMEVEAPEVHETTLFANEKEAFALEPVPITPNSEKKRGKRKRKLIVDATKELSNDTIREQLSDFGDLVVPMDLAPPTEQLMLWKKSGGADSLFAQPCSTVVAPQINALFSEIICQMKSGMCEKGKEEEVMRHGGKEDQGDISTFSIDCASVINSSLECEKTHNSELMALNQMDNTELENSSKIAADENQSEGAHPELPLEDSVFVHQSSMGEDSQSTSLHTQSMLDSSIFEDRRIIRRAQKLLNSLKVKTKEKNIQSQSTSTFSLEALCKGATRSQAASTFFCVLVLKKQKALHVQQSAPYQDIIATPGPTFYDRFTA